MAEVRERSVRANIIDGVLPFRGKRKSRPCIRIGETSQVNAFGDREVRVQSVVADELLLVANVGRVDPRVGVALAEEGDTRLESAWSYWQQRQGARCV